MAYIQHFFQLLPILLAIIAAISCALRFTADNKARRHADRQVMLLSVVASVLMIIAQTSWWSTYMIENSLQGTWFANIIWTLFNNLVMIIFIMIAKPFR